MFLCVPKIKYILPCDSSLCKINFTQNFQVAVILRKTSRWRLFSSNNHITPDRSRRAMNYYWYYIWLMMIAKKRAKERRIALKMMIYLYNLRARMVGINQIKNFFQPALIRDARSLIN